MNLRKHLELLLSEHTPIDLLNMIEVICAGTANVATDPETELALSAAPTAEFEVDPQALVRRQPGGVWVSAWVWIEVDPDED